MERPGSARAEPRRKQPADSDRRRASPRRSARRRETRSTRSPITTAATGTAPARQPEMSHQIDERRLTASARAPGSTWNATDSGAGRFSASAESKNPATAIATESTRAAVVRRGIHRGLTAWSGAAQSSRRRAPTEIRHMRFRACVTTACTTAVNIGSTSFRARPAPIASRKACSRAETSSHAASDGFTCSAASASAVNCGTAAFVGSLRGRSAPRQNARQQIARGRLLSAAAPQADDQPLAS